MPRTVPSGLLTVIGQDMMTLAICIRCTREDGRVFGFTSHDVDLIFGGITFEASSGIFTSAVRQTHGQGVDNLDIIGVLVSSRITDTDILAGLYDNAKLEVFIVNWMESPIVNTSTLTVGYLGEITIGRGTYTAELRSIGARLEQSIAEITSPTCRVRQWGDTRCNAGGNMVIANFQFNNTPVTILNADTRIMTFGPLAGDALSLGYFDYGRVLFQTGPNTGLQQEIKSTTTGVNFVVVTLHESFPFAVAVGNQAMLEAGCDRTLPTCRDKFANAINYRGEPFLPSNDKVVRWGRRT